MAESCQGCLYLTANTELGSTQSLSTTGFMLGAAADSGYTLLTSLLAGWSTQLEDSDHTHCVLLVFQFGLKTLNSFHLGASRTGQTSSICLSGGSGAARKRWEMLTL